MDFKFRIILHVCFEILNLLHIFIVQCIDLDLIWISGVRYIKINIIIIMYWTGMAQTQTSSLSNTDLCLTKLIAYA